MFKENRGYIYHIELHIAWTTYKQYELIEEEYQEKVKEYLMKYESEIYHIEMVEVSKYYVLLTVQCHPKMNITELLKSMKGGSAKYILKMIPSIKDMNINVWDGKNIISTGDPNQVKEEIEKRKQHKKGRGTKL